MSLSNDIFIVKRNFVCENGMSDMLLLFWLFLTKQLYVLLDLSFTNKVYPNPWQTR
jgi:hypothetical protein